MELTNSVDAEAKVPNVSNGMNPESGGDDLFSDLSNIRVSQDFSESVSLQRVITKVLVRKPGKQEFVRTLDDPTQWVQVSLLVWEEDRETFLVTPNFAEQMEGEAKPHFLVPTISRQNNVFLWPIPISAADSSGSSWHHSALEAAKLARERWVRIFFKNLPAGQYEVLTAKRDYGPPEWPAHSINDLLRLAFRDRVVSSADHPVVRRLNGEE